MVLLGADERIHGLATSSFLFGGLCIDVQTKGIVEAECDVVFGLSSFDHVYL